MCARGLSSDWIGKHIAEAYIVAFKQIQLLGDLRPPIQILGGLSPLETPISAVTAGEPKVSNSYRMFPLTFCCLFFL